MNDECLGTCILEEVVMVYVLKEMTETTEHLS